MEDTISRLLDLFQGEKMSSPPIWFMRQAGRSLPEYLEIRKKCKTFFDLCYTPDLAAKVTLQPVTRFNLDAAILFSDILTIPGALGQQVSFEEGKGPHLSSLSLLSFEDKLSFQNFFKTLQPVYETIQLVKSQFSPLIGFTASPWTLALYMLEGEGSRDFAKAKQHAFENEEKFSEFLMFLVQAISLHLIEQVKAGADVIQLFDTWAVHCPATHFQKWIVEPTKAIVSTLHKEFPSLPIIGFPKGIGSSLIPYAQETGVKGLSLDSTTPLDWAVKSLPSNMILQGNLDPLLLVAGGDPLKKAIESIHQQMAGRPYIFNLGHGVLPQTPLEHIYACVQWVRALG
jgi:uroporphyrinogen decarboxylase